MINERIRLLAEQVNPTAKETVEGDWPYNCAVWTGEEIGQLAELIVRECTELNRTQSYELSGVVVDTEDGHGFDDVCLTTVKRIEQYLAGDDLLKHFGVEE